VNWALECVSNVRLIGAGFLGFLFADPSHPFSFSQAKDFSYFNALLGDLTHLSYFALHSASPPGSSHVPPAPVIAATDSVPQRRWPLAFSPLVSHRCVLQRPGSESRILSERRW